MYKHREKTSLEYTDGDIVLLSPKHSIPSALSSVPLKMSEEGFEAVMSGRRSALMEIDGEHYKLKGCNPIEGKMFSASDLLPDIPKELDFENISPYAEPAGSMFLDSANKEIECQKMFAIKQEEFGMEPSLVPLARYDYSVEGRHCVVSVCNGDIRFNELMNFFNKNNSILNDYKKQFELLSHWFGFAQYLTLETFNTLGDESNNPNNYVIQKHKEGYCLARVDFPKVSKSRKHIKPNLSGNFSQVILEFLNRNGKKEKLEDLLFAAQIISCGKEEERITYEDGETIIYMQNEHIPDLDKHNALFQRGLEGVMPEPIDKKFLHQAMSI